MVEERVELTEVGVLQPCFQARTIALIDYPARHAGPGVDRLPVPARMLELELGPGSWVVAVK